MKTITFVGHRQTGKTATLHALLGNNYTLYIPTTTPTFHEVQLIQRTVMIRDIHGTAIHQIGNPDIVVIFGTDTDVWRAAVRKETTVVLFEKEADNSYDKLRMILEDLSA